MRRTRRIEGWLGSSALLLALALACSKDPSGKTPNSAVGGAAGQPSHEVGGDSSAVGGDGEAGSTHAGAGSVNASGEGMGGAAGRGEDEGPLHQDPPKPIPDFPFDPSKVYLHGDVGGGAFALVTEPNYYMVAGKDVAGKLYKNQLVYWTFEAGLHVVEPDYVGMLPVRDLTVPLNPTANDAVFETPACPDDVYDFLTSPDDRLLYECPDLAWYEGGTKLYNKNVDVEFLHLGSDGLVLVEKLGDLATISLSDGIVHASDSPAVERQYYRARGNGFRFVPPPPLGDERPELWNIDAEGKTELVGQYPLPPDGVYIQFATVLAPDDTLYQIASDSANTLCVLQRTTVANGGESKIVYTEKAKPIVWLTGGSGWLLSGP